MAPKGESRKKIPPTPYYLLCVTLDKYESSPDVRLFPNSCCISRDNYYIIQLRVIIQIVFLCTDFAEVCVESTCSLAIKKGVEIFSSLGLHGLTSERLAVSLLGLLTHFPLCSQIFQFVATDRPGPAGL